MNTSYTVSVRGPVPPDLARKLAEAHAAAVKASPMSLVDHPQIPNCAPQTPRNTVPPGRERELPWVSGLI